MRKFLKFVHDDNVYCKTDTPEYLFGEDNNSMIAILRNGKFVTDPIGTNVAIRFATPIIIKACGNAEGFFNMLTEDWCKFHAITFCGGNINALYTPGIAIEQPDVSELLKYDGARTIKMRPWSAYTRTTQFQIENEKVQLNGGKVQRYIHPCLLSFMLVFLNILNCQMK